MANLDKADSWLRHNGRSIDVALVQFETTNSVQPVLDALTAYANSDGGFGHALEPDVRLSESSVLATTVALQTLSRCNQPSSNMLVKKAMGYLEMTFDRAQGAWPIVPANVGDAAHAPWWRVRYVGECLINPRAEVIGYMYRWPELCDLEIRGKLNDQLMSTLAAANSLEMHDILVFDRMVRSLNYPVDQFEKTIKRLYALAGSAISVNPPEWAAYGLTPLSLIDDPSHLLAPRFRDALKLNFEFLSDTQNEDGSWSPSWSWHGTYADEWPEAEKDMKSFVTRESVNLFRRFEGLR